MEEMLRILTTTTLKFQQDTQSSIKHLEMQMSQLATFVSRLESRNSGELSSQSETNPRNVNAVTLRSGKQLEEAVKLVVPSSTFEQEDKETAQTDTGSPSVKQAVNSDSKQVSPSIPKFSEANILPFSSRVERAAKANKEKQVTVNPNQDWKIQREVEMDEEEYSEHFGNLKNWQCL
ncbi:hypothetical protein ACS0TY_002497 [Phlomoides rotata]